jgi:hypothetical protein
LVSTSPSPLLQSACAGAAHPRQAGAPFLRIHTAHIAAVDLFVIPTIGFKLLHGLVIMRLERRRLVWIKVTAHPPAEWMDRPADHRNLPVGRRYSRAAYVQMRASGSTPRQVQTHCRSRTMSARSVDRQVIVLSVRGYLQFELEEPETQALDGLVTQ